MKQSLFLLTLLLFYFPFCSGQTQGMSLRAEIKQVAEAMAEDKVLTNETAGIAASPSVQWMMFEMLQKEATTEELFALTEYPSAVVKCYAFQALTNRTGVDLYPLVIKHLTDRDTVYTFRGCLRDWAYTGDYFLAQVHPQFTHPGGLYKLTSRQKAGVDSLLLYDPKIILRAKDQLLSQLPPLPEYYQRVRQLALQEKNLAAFVALAKYRKQADKASFLSLFDKRETEYYGLQVAREFPDEAFYASLVKVFNREWTDTHYNYRTWSVVYQALARYPRKETLELFSRIIKTPLNLRSQSLGTYLLIAISNYPHPLFSSLKKEIHLDKSHQEEVKEELKGE